MTDYNKELENNLLEMIRQKEAADRHLLTMEIVTQPDKIHEMPGMQQKILAQEDAAQGMKRPGL